MKVTIRIKTKDSYLVYDTKLKEETNIEDNKKNEYSKNKKVATK